MDAYEKELRKVVYEMFDPALENFRDVFTTPKITFSKGTS